MKLTVSAKVTREFVEENTDMSICCFCGEMIYSKMYRIVYRSFLNEKVVHIDKTSALFCSSCMNFVNDHLKNISDNEYNPNR